MKEYKEQIVKSAEKIKRLCADIETLNAVLNIEPRTTNAQIRALRKAAYILIGTFSCLILLCVPAFAQPKSVAVADFLGAKVAQQPTGPVVYTFERGAPLKRTGYGERSYTALLRAVPAYSDATLGKCVSITVRGKEQGPARYVEKRRERPAQVEQASLPIENYEQADPVRPRKYTGSVQPMPESDGFGGAGISIPDSLEMVARMEGAKDQIEQWKQEAKATGQPVASFLMYLFWNAFWMVLLPIAALLWFGAKFTAAEAFATIFGRRVVVGFKMVDAHQFCAQLLVVDVGLCALVLIISFYFRLVTMDFPMPVTVLILFAVTWATYYAAQWFVPNIKSEGSAGRQVEDYQSTPNQRRLPG